MDLCFQGLAWLNKGRTPDNVAQARSFFDRALAADPDNVEALVGSASADLTAGALLFVTDPVAAFAAAEAKLTKALSSVPDHALAHMSLGFVDIFTKRAAEGIAECEHALALDRDLAIAHAFIGFGKIFIGRAEETEEHVGEALWLSPRDTLAYIPMTVAGLTQLHLGSYEQAAAWFRRAIEANRNFRIHICIWPSPWRSLVELPRRIPQSRPASHSTRISPSPAPASLWTAMERRPHVFWVGSSAFSKACARPVSRSK